MFIDFESVTPLYIQLSNALTTAIEEKLPTEYQNFQAAKDLVQWISKQ